MPTTDTMDIILDTLTTDTTDTHMLMPVDTMDTTTESNLLMDIIINLKFFKN